MRGFYLQKIFEKEKALGPQTMGTQDCVLGRRLLADCDLVLRREHVHPTRAERPQVGDARIEPRLAGEDRGVHVAHGDDGDFGADLQFDTTAVLLAHVRFSCIIY